MLSICERWMCRNFGCTPHHSWWRAGPRGLPVRVMVPTISRGGRCAVTGGLADGWRRAGGRPLGQCHSTSSRRYLPRLHRPIHHPPCRLQVCCQGAELCPDRVGPRGIAARDRLACGRSRAGGMLPRAPAVDEQRLHRAPLGSPHPNQTVVQLRIAHGLAAVASTSMKT